MFDKFWITGIKDFTVEQDNHLTVNPSPIRRGLKVSNHILFKYTTGKTQYGKDATYYPPKEKQFKNFTLSINKLGMSIIFNPSMYNSPHNFILADTTKLQQAISGIQKELKQIGVNVSLSGQKVKRVDITKDRQMEYSANQYAQILSMLPSSSRMTKRGYESGFKQENKSWATMFYGKTEHMRDKYNIKLDKPYMRGELALSKSTVVERETGLTRLLEFTSKDNYEYMKQEVYPKLFKKNIFTIQDQLNKYQGIDTNNITSQIEQYITNGMSLIQAFNTVKNQVALNSIVDGYGSIDRLLMELTPILEKNYKQPRVIKSRFRANINEQLKILMFTDSKRLIGSTTPKGLYQELQEKFLKVA
jgi:hypothetical protein